MSDLPKEWARVPLGTIAEISSGVGFPKNRQGIRAGDFPFAKVSDITKAVLERDGRLSEAANYVNAEDLSSLGAKPIPAGSIVFAKIGEGLHLNRRARTTVPVVLDNNCMALTPRERVADPEFLYRFMTTVSLSPFAVATAIPSVRRTDVAQIEVPLPPLAEQRRIVTKLDHLFDRSKSSRKDLSRMLALIERYRGAVLTAAYAGQLSETWRAKQAISIDQIWRSTTLEALSIDLRYGTSAKCNYEPKKTPVLRIPNVVNGRIDLNDLKYASFSDEEIQKLALKEDDLLIIRSNGSLGLVGKAALVPKEVAGYLFAGYLIRIRLDPKRVYPAFVQYALEEPSTRQHVESLAKSTSGVNNINSEQLKAITLQLPSLQEQVEIVQKIRAAVTAINRLREEASRAKALLDRLERATLEKAFRGELVPRDPNDESVASLLSRITLETAAIPARRDEGKYFRKDIPRAPREKAAMTKTRQDDDVKNKPYLASFLKGISQPATTEELFKRSDLSLTDFYKQLAWEVEAGHIRNDDRRLEIA